MAAPENALDIATTGDLELLERLCGNIFGRTFCPLGDGAVMALRGCIAHFRDEFVYHIEEKKCMATEHKSNESED